MPSTCPSNEKIVNHWKSQIFRRPPTSSSFISHYTTIKISFSHQQPSKAHCTTHQRKISFVNTNKMVNDMSYSTVSTVVDSWEKIRRLPNFRELVGEKLFEKLFMLEPAAKRIFGFDDPSGEFMMLGENKNTKFTSHARYFIQMIDKALGLLGPDIELLTEILMDLGKKHVHYGVRPEFFPSMGRALLLVLAEHLGDDFTQSTRDAWVEVYGALSYDMIRAQKLNGGIRSSS